MIRFVGCWPCSTYCDLNVQFLFAFTYIDASYLSKKDEGLGLIITVLFVFVVTRSDPIPALVALDWWVYALLSDQFNIRPNCYAFGVVPAGLRDNPTFWILP